MKRILFIIAKLIVSNKLLIIFYFIDLDTSIDVTDIDERLTKLHDLLKLAKS